MRKRAPFLGASMYHQCPLPPPSSPTHTNRNRVCAIFRRIPALEYTNYMEKHLQALLTFEECDGDFLLARMIHIQQFAERVVEAVRTDEPEDPTVQHAPVSLHLKTLRKEFRSQPVSSHVGVENNRESTPQYLRPQLLMKQYPRTHPPPKIRRRSPNPRKRHQRLLLEPRLNSQRPNRRPLESPPKHQSLLRNIPLPASPQNPQNPILWLGPIHIRHLTLLQIIQPELSRLGSPGSSRYI